MPRPPWQVHVMEDDPDVEGFEIDGPFRPRFGLQAVYLSVPS